MYRAAVTVNRIFCSSAGEFQPRSNRIWKGADLLMEIVSGDPKDRKARLRGQARGLCSDERRGVLDCRSGARTVTVHRLDGDATPFRVNSAQARPRNRPCCQDSPSMSRHYSPSRIRSRSEPVRCQQREMRVPRLSASTLIRRYAAWKIMPGVSAARSTTVRTILTRGGVTRLQIDRQAANLDEALASAIQNAERRPDGGPRRNERLEVPQIV